MDKSVQETRRALLKASAAAPLVATLHPSNAMAMTSAAYACLANNGAADAIRINDIPVMTRVERAPKDLPEALVYYSEGGDQQLGRYFEIGTDGESWVEYTGQVAGPLLPDPETTGPETTGPETMGPETTGPQRHAGIDKAMNKGVGAAADNVKKYDYELTDSELEAANGSLAGDDADDSTEEGDYYRQTDVTSAIAGYDLTAPEGPKLLGPQPIEGGDAVSNSCLSSLVDAMAFSDGY